jgi:hypothetical protein
MVTIHQGIERFPPIHWLRFKPIYVKPREESGYWRPPDWIEIGHYWLDKEQVRSKKLFVIGDMEIRDADLSPDRRYFYMIGDRTYVGEIGKPKFQKLSRVGAYYLCRFSPNSRYLVGRNLVSGSLRLFDYQYGKQWELTEAHVVTFGWYPDSRRVWYSVILESGNEVETVYYVQDVLTKRRRRLTKQEASKIYTEWDLLNPRFLVSYPEHQGNKAYAYSSDNRIRVKVEPYHVYSLDHLDDRSNVSLERRGGSSQLLLKAGSHPWAKIYPQDVSLDGRWVLLVVGQWGKGMGDQRQLEHDLVVIETETQKIFYPFREREEYRPVYGVPPLKQVYWFGKE